MKKLSCQNQEKNMDISSTVYKWKPSKTVLDFLLDFDLRGQQIWWILAKSNSLKW